ncbi:MAG: TrkH family potassium uptake protein [Christensenellales bacterium]|jgi:trk system potassium uptake protein TrkH
MNFGMIRYLLAMVLRFEAAFMGLSLIVSLLYGEYQTALVFGIVIAAMALISFAFGKKPKNELFYAKEGVIAVSLSWLVISVFGALPFYFTGAIPSVVDALFETVSGFTTTGSSILTDVEAMEKGLLFWRSFTHWIGGMGFLVFVLSILPMSGADPLHLMRAESPGPTTEKLVPKARQTAKILYAIYLGLTVLQIILLLAGGMPLFDSVTHTFGTAGTGGFSIKNASIGAYNSVYIEVVITVFMALFGINFSAYFLLLNGKIRQFFRHEETRVYLAIMIASMLLVAFDLWGRIYGTFGEALRYSSFQVSSVMTTTGYATANFAEWPSFSRVLLVALMFAGASAGSTGGGIKISRLIIMFKTIKREALRILHPQAVRVIKLDNVPLQEEVIHGTGTFIVVYGTITMLSVLLVALDGYDLTTSATAVAACINNIGPGLGHVSPVGNFSMFSAFSKIVLFIDMLIGRLEIYPMLLLISPAIWRRRKA